LQASHRKLRAHVEFLPVTDGGQEVINYAPRYPTAARNLVKLLGYQVDSSEAAYRAFGESIPFVIFVV
jgi:hypothetical protein